MREEQVLPRGLLSRLLSGSFFFLALAPLGVLTAFAIGLQDAKIGVGIAVIIGAWAALQLGARSRWDPDSRRVLYGFGRFSLARQVPAGVDVQIIPGAEYRGAPWNGIGYFPDFATPVVNPMPVYLPGSGWLGDHRREVWLTEINRHQSIDHDC